MHHTALVAMKRSQAASSACDRLFGFLPRPGRHCVRPTKGIAARRLDLPWLKRRRINGLIRRSIGFPRWETLLAVIHIEVLFPWAIRWLLRWLAHQRFLEAGCVFTK
jgi:hypothetical protein